MTPEHWQESTVNPAATTTTTDEPVAVAASIPYSILFLGLHRQRTIGASGEVTMGLPRSRLVVISAALVGASVLFAPPARAYLDPGTGSYVFQMLIAVALSAAFTVKHYWKTIKEKLRRRFAGKTQEAPPNR